MTASSRLLVGALVRLVLLFFACWFAIRQDSLGADAPMLSRIGISVLFLVLFIVIGEVTQMRMHMGVIASALRSIGGGAAAPLKVMDAMAGADGGGDDGAEAGGAHAQQAVPLLIEALDSPAQSTKDAAHRHLMRLTGQSHPPESAAWERWWQAEGQQDLPAAGA